MRLGTSITMAGYATEAVWLLAHAAKMTEDPHVLNNLAHALNLDADHANARQLLLAARCGSSDNPLIYNNLAYTNYQMSRFEEAEMAERKAVSLAPEPEYLWSLCKILNAENRPGEAQRYCNQAMTAGIKGILYPPGTKGKEGPGKGGPDDSGEAEKPPGRDDEGGDFTPPASNEDEGMENVPDADPDATIIGQIGKRDRAHDQKPPKPFEFPSNPKPLAELSKAAGQWVGHWEGYKVTGCIKRTRDFGNGLAKTRVK
jgi:tetratricopeptide (TPR) repeat protein